MVMVMVTPLYGLRRQRGNEKPGVGYFMPELADAAMIREQTRHPVASGVYRSGD